MRDGPGEAAAIREEEAPSKELLDSHDITNDENIGTYNSDGDKTREAAKW